MFGLGWFLALTVFLSFFFSPLFLKSSYAATIPYTITTGIPLSPFIPIPGLNFFTTEFKINYQSGNVFLSLSPDGTGQTLVNDYLEINITRPDGTTKFFSLTYPDGFCINLNAKNPLWLKDGFLPGENTVRVNLKNICGFTTESTSLYLVNINAPQPSPTPSPSPSGPTPFLDLPWDYQTNGMTFNEAATSINAYFDHEYPFLSTSLAEPTKLISFRGGFARDDLDYSSHDGYDYGKKAKTKLDTPLLAPADGEAVFMGSCGPCGNAILIDHKNGFQTRYYHLQPDGLIVNQEGQKVSVTKGQQIGKVGFTGNVVPGGEDGAHIHFMVIEDKNGNGDFEDNIPDGLVDPFGWQSKEPDPWENYNFSYAGQQRTGNKSYYLFTKPLDNLNANLTANAAVFNIGKTKLEFPQGSTNENLTLIAKSEPNYTSDILNSLGSTINIVAKNPTGNPVTSFLANFILTIDFSQFDLDRYNLDTLSIYSSPDGENWTKENTSVDIDNKTASTSINHLTYFALMGERRDSFAPTTTAVLEGEKGEGNNFRSDVTVNLNALDNQGGLGVEFTAYGFEEGSWQTFTSPLTFRDEGNYKIHFYSQDKDDNLEEVKSVEFSIDKTPPEISIISPEENKIYFLNQSDVFADFSCSDAHSGLHSCQGSVLDEDNIDTRSVGQKIFKVEALDFAGNKTTKDFLYRVQYNSNGLCNGEPGNAILQPINPDGASIFKQGSTVPAKFRVCHNSTPVSDPNLVKSFNLVKTVSGTTTTTINESVISTTPDPNFRYDPLNKQWIFNMNTKNLSAGKTYFYKILLNDLTEILFNFGLR